MPVALSLADELYYTTVNLVRVAANGPIGTGTGFFWRTLIDDDREINVIITNKHVVENADHLIAVCHEVDDAREGPSGRFVHCVISLSPSFVVKHPDPSVDLCAILFSPTINQAFERGTPLFFKAVTPENVPTDDDWETFDSIEEVLMIGCPRGIYDQFNNLPIVRRGITATPMGKRYEGRPEFMVDMACFPGSSGSPVFLMQTGGYFDRKQQTFNLGGGRFFFVGVLYCGPIITNDGRVVLSQQPRVAVDAMMHLGQVIRSSALLEVEAELRTHIAQLSQSAEAA